MSGEVKHSSHVIRSSDSSVYDERCVNCGSTDDVMRGWGALAKPCPKPPGEGGMTQEEWDKKAREEGRVLLTS